MNSFPKQLYHFTFPRAAHERSSASAFSRTLRVAGHVKCDLCHRVQWCLTVASVWTGLVTNSAEYFHMLTCHLNTYCGVKSLFIFCQIFSWVVSSLSFGNSLYVLNINS